MEAKEKVMGFTRFNYFINKIAVYTQVICIIAMSILIFADVAMRFLFAKPISGCAELVGFMMTIVGFMGLGICALENSHLKIDILINKLPLRAQIFDGVINSVLVIVISALMTYTGFRQGMTVLGYGTKATLTKLYVYPFYWLMALGFALLCLAGVSNLAEGLSNLKNLGKADKKS